MSPIGTGWPNGWQIVIDFTFPESVDEPGHQPFNGCCNQVTVSELDNCGTGRHIDKQHHGETRHHQPQHVCSALRLGSRDICHSRRLPTSLTVSTALTELHRQHHADYQGQPDQSHDEAHDVAPASGTVVARLR
jgi:hypothetical protein